jgi:hypothetical protein
MKPYYTYAYLREDGTPYYIGMGKGGRAWDKRHNVSLPTADRIQILKEFDTREEAIDLEIALIAKYGRKDLDTGILYNRTDGGDGAEQVGPANGMYGRTHTKETRAKIKEARAKQESKPWSDEQKQMMSKKFKGRARPPRLDGLPDHHTNEAKEKIRQAHLGKPKKKGFKQSEEQKRKKLESYRATMEAKKLALNQIKDGVL